MTMIETPKATTGKIILAAVLLAAGHPVTTGKQACSPRCIWQYPDTPATRMLIYTYESGAVLDIPQQDIWRSYTRLTTEARQMQQGRLAGGRV